MTFVWHNKPGGNLIYWKNTVLSKFKEEIGRVYLKKSSNSESATWWRNSGVCCWRS